MRRTRWTLAALAGVAALAAVPPTALAAPGWTGATALPESRAAGYPSVAYDADGTATAFWTQNINPQGVKTASKHAGGSWSQPTTLPGAYSLTGTSALEIAPGETATAVWAGMDDEIQTASRNADGTWSAYETLSVDGAQPSGQPSLAIDRNGTATAAWPEGCEVVVATRPARSDSWSNPRAIFTAPDDCQPSTAGYGSIQRSVALGTDRDGNVTVLWRVGTSSALAVQSVKSSVRTGGARGSWSEPKVVATPPGRVRSGYDDYTPRLVVDVDGRAVATWATDAPAGGGAIVATRPAGVDAAWDATLQTLPSTAPATTSLALDAHGRASVAWNVAADGETPPSVRLATITAAGGLSAAEMVATLPEGGQPAYAPRLALDDDGGALVAWSRNRDGDGEGAFVEAARRPAGGSWSAVQTLASDAAVRTVVGLAGDPLGNATVVWPVGPEAVDAGDTSSLTHLASADYNAEPALRTDWSGRTDPTTNSLHSWVRYLYTWWPSAIPGVPDGPGFVELTDGATWPDAEDRYSWRWGQHDSYRDVTTGELVIEQQGTLRFAMPSHGIDVRLVNPALRVAADGRRARLIGDGLAGGSMEEARRGNAYLRPFEDVHVLDVDLAAGGHRAGEAVGRRSWIAAPATVTPAAGEALGLAYVGVPFGKLTFSAPVSVPDREPPVDPRPPVDPPAPPVDPPRPPVLDPPAPRPPVTDPPSRSGSREPRVTKPRAARLGRTGTATVATIACPRGTCRVTVPRQVRVRVGGRRYAFRVLAPRTVGAGKRAAVRVRLSRAARARLAGRRIAVRLAVRVSTAEGTTRTTVRVTLTVPRAARRAGARR